MIGLVITIILVLMIVIYVLKSIFEETDYQTWLNIALVTVILLTVILSIFMILNKAGDSSKKQNTPPAKQEQKIEENENEPKQTKEQEAGTLPTPTENKSTEEMSDEELSIVISENFLKLKNNYEKLNPGKDGSIYAANKIIQEYDLTKDEWDDFYKKSVQNGYLKQAEENLKKQTDYLIKKS